jgi:hypothetical protein
MDSKGKRQNYMAQFDKSMVERNSTISNNLPTMEMMDKIIHT